jgi:hypothetical protein
MLTLRNQRLSITIDPSHGAEVLDIINLSDGRQLLGRPPFSAEASVPGDVDEASWTRCYRGGWQLLTPNAGNACDVANVRQGFHGRASVDPWHVDIAQETTATVSWSGHGLCIHRTISLVDDAVDVLVRFVATAPRV